MFTPSRFTAIGFQVIINCIAVIAGSVTKKLRTRNIFFQEKYRAQNTNNFRQINEKYICQQYYRFVNRKKPNLYYYQEINRIRNRVPNKSNWF